ncbi:hypothetical protein EG832_08285 [bacterium]|nr:hypothetical protein [bacterium]
MMNQPNSKAQIERSITRYVRALDASNLDEIAEVLQIAEEDAELDRIIGEINWAYADEIGLSVNSVDSEKVRKLLQENFLSVFSESIEISPITVGEVTAHLIANQLVPPADQENSLKLLHINIPLPKWLSLPEIRSLSHQLSLNVSERFLKAFRDAAIQMSMGRGQAQMTAARRKTSCRPGNDRSNEENNAK